MVEMSLIIFSRYFFKTSFFLNLRHDPNSDGHKYSFFKISFFGGKKLLTSNAFAIRKLLLKFLKKHLLITKHKSDTVKLNIGFLIRHLPPPSWKVIIDVPMKNQFQGQTSFAKSELKLS